MVPVTRVKLDRLFPEEPKTSNAPYYKAPAQTPVNPEWPNSTNYNGFLSHKYFIYRSEAFRKANLECRCLKKTICLLMLVLPDRLFPVRVLSKYGSTEQKTFKRIGPGPDIRQSRVA
jgi:hypothetical protein